MGLPEDPDVASCFPSPAHVGTAFKLLQALDSCPTPRPRLKERTPAALQGNGCEMLLDLRSGHVANCLCAYRTRVPRLAHRLPPSESYDTKHQKPFLHYFRPNRARVLAYECDLISHERESREIQKISSPNQEYTPIRIPHTCASVKPPVASTRRDIVRGTQLLNIQQPSHKHSLGYQEHGQLLVVLGQ